MLAQNLLIVLLLVSNITLASGFLDVIAAVSSYMFNVFLKRDGLLPFDTKREYNRSLGYYDDVHIK